MEDNKQLENAAELFLQSKYTVASKTALSVRALQTKSKYQVPDEGNLD